MQNTKKEFLLEVVAKEHAMKYFPNFYGSDCTISSNKTLGELREEYLNYCEEYFTKLDLKDDADKIKIKMAYDYMKNILENRDKVYQSKSDIIKQVLDAYERLMEAIAGYSFCPKWANSVGNNQNRTNKQIVFEISLLKPILTMVLENIDAHFEKITEVTAISYFDNQLIEKLEGLIEELNYVSERIAIAERNYHNIWDSANGRDYFTRKYATHSDLGKAKKEWKKTKNNACCTILYFYRRMKDINMSLQPEKMVHTIEETNTLFDCGMKKIVCGPHYYCYLSEEDRKNIIEENMARKRELKREQN